MNHEIGDLTERDLLEVILSPHTTPQDKRDAQHERAKRASRKAAK